MNKYIGPIFWDIGGTARGYPKAGADWACWQGQLYNTNGTLANGDGYATTVQCSNAYIAEINSFGKGIVLMHDPYSYALGSTVDMVKDMVPKLKALGYTFVRADKVPDILALLGCDPSCATCSGTQTDECLTCGPTAYLAGGSCVACTVCAATEFTKVACTATANTVCETCTTCAAGKFPETACSAAADTVCTTCEGSCATCTGPLATDCGTCLAGKYKSATGCLACSTCKPGSTMTAACGPASDTMCTVCPPGTTSDGIDPCTPVVVDAGAGDASKLDAAENADASTGTFDASFGTDASRNDAGAQSPPGDGCSTANGGQAPSVAAISLALAFALRRRRRTAA